MTYSTDDIINAMDFWMNAMCQKGSLTKINSLINKHLNCDVRKVSFRSMLHDCGYKAAEYEYGDWRGMTLSDAHEPYDFDGVKFVRDCMKKTDYYSSFAHMTDIALFNHMLNGWAVDFNRAQTPNHYPAR